MEFFQIDERLFPISLRYLLAVSGGIDSMVLWHYWHTKGYTYGVVHCNFGLRGEESLQEEELVLQTAQARNVPIWVKRFETLEYAQRERLSIQEAARQLRYAYFEEIRRSYGFDYVLTAHQANDQLETVLYHLIKGTSLIGMRGMKFQNGSVLRPFLHLTRQELMSYAQAHQVEWKEDSSNTTDKYARNFIRHHIIPLGKQINPKWEKTFVRTSQKLSAAENLLNEYLQIIQNRYVSQQEEKIIIDKSILEICEPAFVLYEILKKYNFHYDQLCVLGRDTPRTGKTLFSHSHVLQVDRNVWVVSPLKEEQRTEVLIFEHDTSVVIKNSRFLIEYFSNEQQGRASFEEYLQNPNPFQAYFDIERLEFPLIVRYWQKGDRMRVLGLKGSKKISDILTDEKVSPAKKSHIFVVLSGKEIIWLVGFRVSECAKITHQTRFFGKISFENYEN
ncbi:MAG: tRNA lysidine(34) synthetase TilS [Cytophagales bacterium]|nr:tRNA lysidine(34) synthetase TilS [Cytophagales bacterium]MDW8384824.1 tRNA lysidine(34) synthetase TilS [Flammeovirgaceae bacterium]